MKSDRLAEDFGCLADWEAALQKVDLPFCGFQRVFRKNILTIRQENCDKRGETVYFPFPLCAERFKTA